MSGGGNGASPSPVAWADLPPASVPPDAPAITIGAGAKRPQGARLSLDELLPGAPRVAQLAEALRTLPPDADRWWSPGVFKGDYRDGARWQCSSAFSVDADHYDDAGRHAAVPAEVSARAAAASRPPGNVYHPTPRGMRPIFVLAAPERDRERWQRAASGACASVERWLVDAGLAATGNPPRSGFVVDRAASCDIARLFYAPRAIVGGVQRVADVFLLREQPYTVEELLAAAPANSATIARANVTPPATAPAPSCEARAEAVALLAQHYPPLGKRHHHALALAGMLLRGGMSEDDAQPFVHEVAQAGGSSDPAARAAVVRSTAATIAASEPATGGPRLAEIIGDGGGQIVDRVRELLRPRSARPQIVITTDEPAIIDAALDALTLSTAIYRRGGVLVHVVDDHATEKRPKIDRSPGAPRIVLMPPARLREEMARVAGWTIETKEGLAPARVPAWAVAGVAARGEWPMLRPLLTVTDAPTLRADGSVIMEPGYDEATGILYQPTVTFPPVEARPSRDRCAFATMTLLEVVSDFPFEQEHHRAAWLAGLLSVVGRFAFRGPAPLSLHDANVPGAGKSLLVDVVALIATGRAAARMAPDDDDAEMRKRITSVVMAGDRLVLIDNVVGALGGPSLDAALTGEEWQDRVLCTNTTVRLPLTTIWFATGNNVALKGDTSRRVAHVRLRSPEESPEERRDIQIADLRAYVREHRPRLLLEALTILVGYCTAGRPAVDLPPWGSFEEWSALVRSALVWAGAADPAAGRQELRRAAEVEAGGLGALVAGWAAIVGALGGPCTVRSALDYMATPPFGRFVELRAALADLARIPEDKLTSQKIAGVLKRFRDRVVGGRAIVEAGEDRKGAALWGVSP